MAANLRAAFHRHFSLLKVRLHSRTWCPHSVTEVERNKWKTQARCNIAILLEANKHTAFSVNIAERREMSPMAECCLLNTQYLGGSEGKTTSRCSSQSRTTAQTELWFSDTQAGVEAVLLTRFLTYISYLWPTISYDDTIHMSSKATIYCYMHAFTVRFQVSS